MVTDISQLKIEIWFGFSEDLRDYGIEELPIDKVVRAMKMLEELTCVTGLEWPKTHEMSSVAFTEQQKFYF